MKTPTDSHTARAAGIADAHGIWPPPTTPAPDVVDADYGTMNRELLAEKLQAMYWSEEEEDDDDGTELGHWLRVVDVAIAELQGAPNA